MSRHPDKVREQVLALIDREFDLPTIQRLTGVPPTTASKWARARVAEPSCSRCGEQLVRPAELCGWCAEELAA